MRTNKKPLWKSKLLWVLIAMIVLGFVGALMPKRPGGDWRKQEARVMAQEFFEEQQLKRPDSVEYYRSPVEYSGDNCYEVTIYATARTPLGSKKKIVWWAECTETVPSGSL